jgi:hypothetical protein
LGIPFYCLRLSFQISAEVDVAARYVQGKRPQSPKVLFLWRGRLFSRYCSCFCSCRQGFPVNDLRRWAPGIAGLGIFACASTYDSTPILREASINTVLAGSKISPASVITLSLNCVFAVALDGNLLCTQQTGHCSRHQQNGSADRYRSHRVSPSSHLRFGLWPGAASLFPIIQANHSQSDTHPNPTSTKTDFAINPKAQVQTLNLIK